VETITIHAQDVNIQHKRHNIMKKYSRMITKRNPQDNDDAIK